MDRVTHLKQALPYIQKHTGSTFVIKLGGKVLEDHNALRSLAEDISLLHNIGIKIMVIHGGGPQLNSFAAQMGVTQKVISGRRVTDEATLDLTKMIFRGKLNTDLVSSLRELGTLAVGISGLDGGLIEATRRPPVEIIDDHGCSQVVDFGHVGDLSKVNPQLIESLMKSGFVPVLCSLAATKTGGVLNINADTVAEAIASEIKAEKLFLLTDQDGLFADSTDSSTLISYADIPEIQELIDSDVIKGGMKPKIQSTLRALESGVGRVHIINAFGVASLLLEVFTNEGCGTLIVKDKEQVI